MGKHKNLTTLYKGLIYFLLHGLKERNTILIVIIYLYVCMCVCVSVKVSIMQHKYLINLSFQNLPCYLSISLYIYLSLWRLPFTLFWTILKVRRLGVVFPTILGATGLGPEIVKNIEPHLPAPLVFILIYL